MPLPQLLYLTQILPNVPIRRSHIFMISNPIFFSVWHKVFFNRQNKITKLTPTKKPRLHKKLGAWTRCTRSDFLDIHTELLTRYLYIHLYSFKTIELFWKTSRLPWSQVIHERTGWILSSKQVPYTERVLFVNKFLNMNNLSSCIKYLETVLLRSIEG